MKYIKSVKMSSGIIFFKNLRFLLSQLNSTTQLQRRVLWRKIFNQKNGGRWMHKYAHPYINIKLKN